MTEDTMCIDDPIFESYLELLAAVFRRARYDLKGKNVSQEDRASARAFLDDSNARQWALAWTGHRQRGL